MATKLYPRAFDVPDGGRRATTTWCVRPTAGGADLGYFHADTEAEAAGVAAEWSTPERPCRAVCFGVTTHLRFRPGRT